jgi:hypothetical protein
MTSKDVTPAFVMTLKVFAIVVSYPSAMANAVASFAAAVAVVAPISDNTSAFDRLSKPFAVNRAYSSSATDALSILTALVFEMPKVKDA